MVQMTMTPAEKSNHTMADEPIAPSDDGSIKLDYAREQRVVRKLDRALLPLYFVLYMLAFLDRGNIGNARIAGLANDLQIDSYRYNWLLNVFYIAYVFAGFSTLLWKKYPPHRVAAFTVFGWGVVATIQAGMSSWDSLMVLRFLLGAFEASYAPGIIYLMSFFYLRSELGFRVGIFVSAAALASTFAGALAYGITSKPSHLANWRLLFLIEGLPTVILAGIAWFFIPDSPGKSKFLTEEEKFIVRERGIRQVGTDGTDRVGGVQLKELCLTAIDLNVWICGLIYFCGNVTYSSLPVFLPTILEDMGYTAIHAQGLSAPPSFLAFLVALLTTWLADRYQQRCYVLCGCSVIGGIGYTILASVERVSVRYFAIFLASAGVFSVIPNIVTLTINNQGNDSRRAMSIAVINLIGQCGPFLGSNIFPTSHAPRYVEGMTICAAVGFAAAVLSIIARVILTHRNANLDRQYGKRSSIEGSGIAVENYGPNFRYVL